MKNISIGYFADGNWGYETLKRIILEKKIKLNFVCLRYEKPDNKIIEYCKKNKIKFYIFKNINSKKNFRIIFDYKCDLIVSMSYDQIFGSLYQKFFPSRIINCHAGNLPFYRGRNILNWALINGENQFGITVHFVDSGIDTGDIILQKKFKILKSDDYNSLLKKCYKECPKLVLRSINKIQKKNFRAIKQKSLDFKGSYFRKRIAGDEIIDWNQSSEKIYNFVRALVFPGPIAQTFYNKKRIFIHKIKPLKKKSIKKYKSGSIIKLDKKKLLLVKTKNGFVLIKKYYPKVNFTNLGILK